MVSEIVSLFLLGDLQSHFGCWYSSPI